MKPVILGCPLEIPAQNGARYALKTTQTTTILTICTKMFADMCVHDVIHHQSIEALFGLLEHSRSAMLDISVTYI